MDGASMKGEVPEIEPERTILFLLNHLPDQVGVTRGAIGGHPHNFVLSFVDLKAQKGGQCAVQQADRMWEVNFLVL